MSSLNDLKISNSPSPGRRKNNLLRWLLAGAVLGITVAVIWRIFGDNLAPRVAVETASVVLLELAVDGAAGERTPERAVAQASGWIEPDPFSVYVAAQTAGTVLRVLVLSGETVTNGQVLVTLDSADAQLVEEQKRHALALAVATVATREAEVKVAQEQKGQVEAEIEQAESALVVAKDTWDRLAGLADNDVSEVERVAASNQVTQRTAELEAVRSVGAERQARIQQQVALAEAANVAVKEAEANHRVAQLQLHRMNIVSPMDAVVLARLVQPGEQLVQDNSRVMALYDPENLQVRVDVPLADIRHIQVGQSATIQSGAFGGKTFNGEVARITGEADIARNTLQVKVRIEDPDPLMRPEMLCRVEFHAAPEAGDRASGATAQSLWIPESSLVRREGDSASVWLVDRLRDTVSLVGVTVLGDAREGRVPVGEEVTAGAHVVTAGQEALREGMRVKSRGAK